MIFCLFFLMTSFCKTIFYGSGSESELPVGIWIRMGENNTDPDESRSVTLSLLVGGGGRDIWRSKWTLITCLRPPKTKSHFLKVCFSRCNEKYLNNSLRQTLWIPYSKKNQNLFRPVGDLSLMEALQVIMRYFRQIIFIYLDRYYRRVYILYKVI